MQYVSEFTEYNKKQMDSQLILPHGSYQKD